MLSYERPRVLVAHTDEAIDFESVASAQPGGPTVTAEASESAADTDDESVWIGGTAYHDGINLNAWGLTEGGAREIADDLVGADLTASHPFIMGGRYDRSVHEGQGMPIGRVRQTDVAAADGGLDGGAYTATYLAEVQDPAFKARYRAGLLTASDLYSVSVGIYADPEGAVMNIDGQPVEESEYERGETVEVDGERVVAGPLYDGGESDHLAAVYLPAYEGSSAEVQSSSAASVAEQQAGPRLPSTDAPAGARRVASTAAVLGAQATDPDARESTETETESDPESEGYRVRVTGAYAPGDYRVRLPDGL